MLPITVIVFIVYHSFFLVSAVTRPHTASPCPYNTQQNLTLPLRYITLLGTSISGPRYTLRSLRFSALHLGPANHHYTLPFHCNTFMTSPCHALPWLCYAKRYNAMPPPRQTLLNFTLPSRDYTLPFHYVVLPFVALTALCIAIPPRNLTLPLLNATMLCRCCTQPGLALPSHFLAIHGLCLTLLHNTKPSHYCTGPNMARRCHNVAKLR
nr:MAG TPA: hypothetical protein [Caudoviricetes sp.]